MLLLLQADAAKLEVSQIVQMFLGLAVLLAVARVFGELARLIHQPPLLGEIFAGIFLGRTVLAQIAPDAFAYLFPAAGANGILLQGLTVLAVTLFLLVVGMEVDLSTAWKQGRSAVTVGFLGMVLPFSLGLVFASLFTDFLDPPGEHRLPFVLFFATAVSISALPVIARTLMDLNLYRTDLGMTLIAAAILNDLAGWVIFAVILGMIETESGQGLPIHYIIPLTLGFLVFWLTLGRWLIHWSLPWIQAHTGWPSGVLGSAIALGLFGAAFTEWIGVHAIFGAFIVGVAIGDSSHLRQQTRATMDNFISSIFAPLFFASIGLHVDFIAHFDPVLTGVVLMIACSGKVLGCYFGASLTGMSRRESWALGFGMAAQGAMQIILGLLAKQYGLISEDLFVALVVMALFTSMISGPVLQMILQRRAQRRLRQFVTQRTFVGDLSASSQEHAVRELARVAAPVAKVEPEQIVDAVMARERIMSTGLNGGVAVPHARLAELEQPVVAVGIAEEGVDFNSRDGQPARLIFMVLSPQDDDGAQLELLADVGRIFGDASTRNRAVETRKHIEFLALLQTGATQSAQAEHSGG